MTRVTYLTRRLFVLFLVPVVWLGVTPEMAAAANGSASLEFNIERLGPNVSCAVPITYGNLGVDGQIKTGRGWCYIATSDGLPGTCSILQADCTTYDLQFPGCDSYNTRIADNDGSAPWPSVRVTLEAATISLGNCVPSSVCLVFHTEKLFNDQDGSACVSVDFSDGLGDDAGGGPRDPADLTCEWGHPQGVVTQHVYTWGSELWKDRIWLQMLDRESSSAVPNSDHWHFDIPHGGTPPTFTEKQGWSTQYGGTWDGLTYEYDPTGSGLGGSHEAVKGEAWGIQVTNAAFSYTGAQMGYTDVENCTFWFGPKIHDQDHPEYGSADPWGPLTDHPGEEPEPLPDPDPAPEPVWSPGPDTDLGGFGGLLTALQALLEAIGDLVGALLDGIKALFVPDKSSWGWGDLRDTAKTKPPFSIIDTLYTEARALSDEMKGAGSCGSLADFTTNGHDMNLTCERVSGGPMGALYSVVQVGLIALTGLGLFRIVSGYFEKNG